MEHAAIFVHGCFWHRHKGCKEATTPKTRMEFWFEKFDKNVRNDQIKQEKLRARVESVYYLGVRAEERFSGDYGAIGKGT